jgi:uncharacterized protein YdeI (YjbR/CyaY-like superfamily)
MAKKDKRVDAYIAKAPDHAKPVLEKIREVFHAGAPDCEETLKWGHPAFMQNGILGGMAAFTEYCAFNLWKQKLILGDAVQQGSAGSIGKIASVKDLPPKKTLVGDIKKAVELNASGVKAPRLPAKKKQLEMPAEFMAAIRKNKKALAGYEKFSPSQQREYVEWIVDAKQEATRDRRIAQAVEWLAEGKPRNWKYM